MNFAINSSSLNINRSSVFFKNVNIIKVYKKGCKIVPT